MNPHAYLLNEKIDWNLYTQFGKNAAEAYSKFTKKPDVYEFASYYIAENYDPRLTRDVTPYILDAINALR